LSGIIVAMGGGGFSLEPDDPKMDDYVLALTGKARPRVLFLAQAGGESDQYVRRFYQAFGHGRTDADDLSLFVRDGRDPRERILSQDVVYVGGGNTANLLAIWRIHGVDAALREYWENGGILCGPSAGAICWFESSTTDSFGGVQALRDGLGLLPGSCCPHYDGEPLRRPTYHRLVADGTLPAGIAIDDGAAARFVGTELREVVSSRPEGGAYRVERAGGGAVETALPVRRL
jgi:peptidase E